MIAYFRKSKLLVFTLLFCVTAIGFLGIINKYKPDFFPDFIAGFREKPFYIKTVCWFETNTKRKQECGYLYVEERRGVSDSERLVRLPVIIFRRNTASTETDPILFLPGGPESATGRHEIARRLWEKRIDSFDWARGRDLIVFDYRGLGRSRPSLSCSEENNFNVLTWRRNLLHIMRECVSQVMRNGGVSLEAYTTHEIVSDIEDLRKSLSVRKWNIWAQSYGTRVALELAKRAPESIRSIVLTGAAPSEAANLRYLQATRFREDLLWICQTCKQTINCNQAYPRLREVFQELMVQIGEVPVEIDTPEISEKQSTQTISLDQLTLLDILFSQSSITSQLSRIPQTIYALKNGRADLVEKVVSDILYSHWLNWTSRLLFY